MVYKMEFSVDGGCRNNGKRNAFGAVAACMHFRHGKKYNYWTRRLDIHDDPHPTNQRAEITAITLALEKALERYERLDGRPYLELTIESDSKYAVQIMNEWIYKWANNGWINSRGEDVANKDLIVEASHLDDEVAELGEVKYVWVPREDNVDADKLCNEVLDEMEEEYWGQYTSGDDSDY